MLSSVRSSCWYRYGSLPQYGNKYFEPVLPVEQTEVVVVESSPSEEDK